MKKLLLTTACACAFFGGLNAQHYIDEPKGLRDWLKFRINAGAVLNSTYNDVPRRNESTHFSSLDYSPVSPTSNRAGFNTDLNLICGPNSVVKHVIGIGYIHSYSEYQYHESNGGPNGKGMYGTHSQVTNLTYQQYSNYLTVHSGVAFYIGHFSIETGMLAAASLKSKRYKTGFVSDSQSEEVYNQATGTYTYVTTKSMQTYDRQREYANPNTFSGSAIFRINYDLLKEEGMGLPFGIYLGGSIGFTQNIGWYYAGIQYYPFRKMR